MSIEVSDVKSTEMYNIFTCEFEDGSTRLCTKNLAPGHKVYGERLIYYGGSEYREWNAFRSKMAGAIMKGLKFSPFKEGSKILYLGVASGTTASHLSDIIGKEGRVYGIEFSPRVVRELLLVVQHRPNLLPILADARFPVQYRTVVEDVDVIYTDVAQPNQAEIASNNARFFLKEKGILMLAIKSRSIDVTKDPQEVYKEEVKRLESSGFSVRDVIPLDPYDKDHAMVVAEYNR